MTSCDERVCARVTVKFRRYGVASVIDVHCTRNVSIVRICHRVPANNILNELDVKPSTHPGGRVHLVKRPLQRRSFFRTQFDLSNLPWSVTIDFEQFHRHFSYNQFPTISTGIFPRNWRTNCGFSVHNFRLRKCRERVQCTKIYRIFVTTFGKSVKKVLHF